MLVSDFQGSWNKAGHLKRHKGCEEMWHVSYSFYKRMEFMGYLFWAWYVWNHMQTCMIIHEHLLSATERAWNQSQRILEILIQNWPSPHFWPASMWGWAVYKNEHRGVQCRQLVLWRTFRLTSWGAAMYF